MTKKLPLLPCGTENLPLDRGRLGSDPRKILVVRFSSIGDLILLTPLLRELKKTYPSAEIHLLTKSAYAGIFERNPHLAKILAMQPGESLHSLLARISRESYQLVFDAHSSLRSRALLAWNKAGFPNRRCRVFSVEKRFLQRYPLVWIKRALTNRVSSQVESHLRMLVQASGRPVSDRTTEVFPSETNEREAETAFSKGTANRRIIAFNPCASYFTKRWPVDCFCETASRLNHRFSVAVIGERENAESARMMKVFPKAVDLRGMPLLTLAAALKKCDLTITNDSMVTHLSEAVGTRVLCLFGGTVPEFGFAPLLSGSRYLIHHVPCQPCDTNGKRECPKGFDPPACFEGLKPAEVCETALEMLGEKRWNQGTNHNDSNHRPTSKFP